MLPFFAGLRLLHAALRPRPWGLEQGGVKVVSMYPQAPTSQEMARNTH